MNAFPYANMHARMPALTRISTHTRTHINTYTHVHTRINAHYTHATRELQKIYIAFSGEKSTAMVVYG